MTKGSPSRKQLLNEPDQFITVTGKLIAFGRSHVKSILICLGAFALLLVIAVTLRQVSIRNENRASERIEKVMAAYAAALEDTDAVRAYERVKGDVADLFDEYGAKNAVKTARIVFGDISYRAGDADTAIDMYTRALEDFDQSPALKNIVLSGLGHAHALKKEYDTAIGYFETIAGREDVTLKSDALYNLAWLYEAAGKPEQSRERYEQLVADFPDTVYGDLVREKIGG